MAAVLDPQPEARRRWERKMLIREVRRRGRLSRTQKLKRTERECLSKSHFIKTSVKKLGPLARQISGKSVEDAIVQMQFSKKKAAKSVREHLEHARNEAIVRRGMGLGEVDGKKEEPVQIETKDGRRRTVTDQTGMYIDQAWVGRGPYGREPEFRARGRVNILRPPVTSKQTLSFSACVALLVDHRDQVSRWCSRKRRRGSGSIGSAKRNVETGRCGPRFRTGPSRHSISTTLGDILPTVPVLVLDAPWCGRSCCSGYPIYP